MCDSLPFQLPTMTFNNTEIKREIQYKDNSEEYHLVKIKI